MRIKAIITVAFLTLTLLSNAQDYKTAVGFKVGAPSFGALNIKHFLGSTPAIDISLGGGSNHIWLQGLYEINNPISDGFSWYYGGGADIGFWSRGVSYTYNGKNYSGAWAGIAGVAGIEYTFSEFPFNVAFEAVPTVRVLPYVGFGINGALAIRFAIK